MLGNLDKYQIILASNSPRRKELVLRFRNISPAKRRMLTGVLCNRGNC